MITNRSKVYVKAFFKYFLFAIKRKATVNHIENTQLEQLIYLPSGRKFNFPACSFLICNF